MEKLEGKIIQIADLFVYENGALRHVKLPWEKFEQFCIDKNLKHDFAKRAFLTREEMREHKEGRAYTDWPEKEPEVGPERLFFCVPQTANFERIADCGGTIVQAYGLVWPPNDPEIYLRKAEAANLKVIFSVKPYVHDLLRDDQPWDREGCRKTVVKYRDYSALCMWYPFDELDAGVDDPRAGVSKELQNEIVSCLKEWSGKGVATSLRGGVKGWHLLDFELYDLVIPDAYVFNGTGMIWDQKPLDYLRFVADQERAYINKHGIETPIMFMGQCDSHPAVDKGLYGTKVPLGEIQNQIDILKEYDLLTPGIAFYGWDGGDFCPNRDDEIYEEIKTVLTKIK